MIITISGQPGAGTTTASRMLAEKIGYRLLTVGEIHKQIAKSHGMEIEEYWKHQEKNPEEQKKFHKELDERQKKESKKGKIIINGKLSAFQIPEADVKVLITADLTTRAERTVKRDGGTVKEAFEKIKKREKMEREGWKKIYGFDYVKDKNKYTMIINSSDKTPEEITKEIIKEIRKKEEE